MKRVLQIMPAYGGGISSFIINIIRASDPAKIVSDVVSYTDYPDFYREIIESKGGHAYTISQIRLRKIFRNIKEIRSLVKRGKYDAVHIHITDVNALYFSTWARSAGVKRVIVHSHQTNHDDNHGLISSFKFSLYRLITTSVATQLSSCSKMASQFRFGERYVRMHKVMHVPNSINVSSYENDISEVKKKALRLEFGVGKDEMFIGHIGRFEKQKNHDFMLNLIKYMKDSGYMFKWIFIGTGNDFDRVREAAKSLDIEDVAIFLGRRNDVSDLFQSMDLSILPSYYEGLPTVAIECQAAGTPMLLADTITPEVDMGLDLVSFMNLDSPYEKWANKILELSRKEHVDAKTRISNIKKRRFTSREAAELYEDFILGLISSYNFEDIQ